MSTATVAAQVTPLFPQAEWDKLTRDNNRTHGSILEIAKKTFDPSDKETAVSLFKRANDTQSAIHKGRVESAATSAFEPYKRPRISK